LLESGCELGPQEKDSEDNNSIEEVYSCRAVLCLIVMVFGVELILAPPTELVLAKWTLHEFTASTMENEHLTPRAFLSPDYLI